MKSEMEQTPVRPAERGLSVEVRSREVNGKAEDACTGEVGLARKSESWGVRAVVLAVVLVIAGTYTWVHIGRGWVPADDGTLSQSALRVMQGQLPHCDFGEIYTGGLSFIHALAFRVFGVNLMSLRICVFLFFLAWLPAVYYIALRFTSAIGAGAITLLAVAWSYPNYPAAMPSWYNLFSATFGAAALLRYLEVRTRRWLFVAGVCGGVSILIKVIGAYYIAGVLLFLAFLEQSESGEAENPKNNWPYRAFSVGALLLFLATLVRVLSTRLGMPELYEFVLPSVSVVGLIVLGERSVRAGTGQRFKTMLRLVIPFLCGLLSPVMVFLMPYARSGMVGKFFFGVTASATSRLVDLGVIRPVGIEGMMYVLPLVGVLAAAMYWDKFQGKAVGAALGLGAAVLVVRAVQVFEIVKGIWFSVAALTPFVVLLGAVVVWARRKPSAKVERQQVVLLISLAATCTLVQFPFAAPIYLSYAVPLTLLAMVAIVSTAKKQSGTYALASVVGLYLAFGVVSLVPRYIYEITYVVGHMDTMQGPRAGGLKVEGAAFFDDMSRFLRAHSPNGLMFAGNDCPQLYFLSGLTNVAHDDGGEPPEEILKAIRSDDLNLVVINDSPYFPGAVMRPEVKAEVARRFPHTTRFGIFQVFWKQ
ncbi:MAG: glycosyltransferase family 39 protein [Acidobacteriia bacterium]|nr:glycosyltransferase family 39 protein [Terriglobia bacterium]